ncbi:MAG: ABC transporter permease subunit [Rhodospirillaceae bacterium]
MSRATRHALPEPVIRPEFINENIKDAHTGDVARELSTIEKIWNINGVRKAVILLGLVASWQLYTVIFQPQPLLFPSFVTSLDRLIIDLESGKLLGKIWFSVKMLLLGYAVGMGIAAVLVLWGSASRLGGDFIAMATAMFNPLPSIAMLPLAINWFGIGTGALVFVLVHAVLWAVALNTHTGFKNVSTTLRMIGQNYGLRGVPFVVKVLVPAALPTIFTGMKVGWAFAWRTLIGAELVFGATGGGGGLGWYIFENSQNIETAGVFAGLFAIILIGITVENVLFRRIELKTVNRWGMQR